MIETKVSAWLFERDVIETDDFSKAPVYLSESSKGAAKEDETMATQIQIDTIEARRVNDVAREMMVGGVTLSAEQSDEISDAGHQWIRDRLGLVTDGERDDGSIRYVAR